MKFLTPAPRAAKSQLKCFQCRQAFSMKDGGWHDHGTQQVFLCKPCEKAFHAQSQKAAKLIK